MVRRRAQGGSALLRQGLQNPVDDAVQLNRHHLALELIGSRGVLRPALREESRLAQCPRFGHEIEVGKARLRVTERHDIHFARRDRRHDALPDAKTDLDVHVSLASEGPDQLDVEPLGHSRIVEVLEGRRRVVAAVNDGRT